MTASLSLPELQDKQDWTVDDLANLPKDLRYELIDGRLVLPSPTGIHQFIGVALVNMLLPNCPAGYLPYPDLSLKVNRRNEPRPDVVVLPMGAGARSPAPIKGALLAIEIVSPDSHVRDMRAKAELYAASGIRSYWVIDPTIEAGAVLTEFRISESGEYEIVTSTSKMFSTDTPYVVTIDVPALTRLRNMIREAHEEA